MSNLKFNISKPAQDVEHLIHQIDIDLVNNMIRIHTIIDGEVKMEWLPIIEIFKLVDQQFIDSIKNLITTITSIQYDIVIPTEDEEAVFKDVEHSLVEDWVKPTGAHDAYNIGDKAKFDGVVYVSLIDGNVWSVTEYPAGWELD